MKPEYVRTKKGIVYPIEKTEDGRCYITGSGGMFLLKEDCEPFQLEDRHKNQDNSAIPIAEQISKETETAAALFLRDEHDNEDVRTRSIGYKCFLAGAKHQANKFAPLQEDQHIITTDQLAELLSLSDVNYSKKVSENLREWFPAVFAPAKTTYKVSDRFTWEGADRTYRIIHLYGSEVGLLVEEKNTLFFGNTSTVEDFESITEQEFDRLTLGRISEFTKLPDTTDHMI